MRGRDWDRALVDNVIKPWLFDNFNLPDDLTINPDYKAPNRLAAWATERAKIELSSRKMPSSVYQRQRPELRICRAMKFTSIFLLTA